MKFRMIIDGESSENSDLEDCKTIEDIRRVLEASNAACDEPLNIVAILEISPKSCGECQFNPNCMHHDYETCTYPRRIHQ